PLDDVAGPAPRVLVADDSAASRALSNHLLSAAGYEVSLVENGAQAWDRLQAECFDIAVMNTVLGKSDERSPLDAGANAYVCKAREDAGRQIVDWVDELLGQ